MHSSQRDSQDCHRDNYDISIPHLRTAFQVALSLANTSTESKLLWALQLGRFAHSFIGDSSCFGISSVASSPSDQYLWLYTPVPCGNLCWLLYRPIYRTTKNVFTIVFLHIGETEMSTEFWRRTLSPTINGTSSWCSGHRITQS